MNRIILHIDMDAFFAAIEQLDHPEFRGKPVVVGADPKGGSGRGVVSTCSYAARKYGIHSAMPISQAYKRCPFAIFTRGRMSRYRDVSRQIMRLMFEFSPAVEPISIDEAFLDISGCIRLLGEPVKIARNLKKRIKDEVGITASVGIAPSKFVAKIASDLEKPDGLVVVEPADVKSFLRPLPISKMWGVGKKTEPTLLKMGIRTIGDIADYSQQKLIKYLGKSGQHFWNLANGIDTRDVEPHTDAKSVSHETTYMEDVDDEQKLTRTLFYLSNEVSNSLRKDKLRGRTITLKIRLEDFTTFSRSKSCNDTTNSSAEIYDVILKLFNNFNRGHKKVRLLGVAVSNLNTSFGEQISLFEKSDHRKSKSDELIDLIHGKYGPNMLKKASLLGIKTHRLSDKKVDNTESNEHNTE